MFLQRRRSVYGQVQVVDPMERWSLAGSRCVQTSMITGDINQRVEGVNGQQA